MEFASVVFNQQAIDEKNNSANLLLGAVKITVMEYTREIKIVIEKDTNKATTKVGLTLGEYDENETVEQFIERVNEYLKDMLIDRG